MTDPLSFEHDAQSLEELRTTAVAFRTGVDTEVVRAVLDAAAEDIQRVTYLQVAAHVMRLSQETRREDAPAWQVLIELAEELRARAEPDED